MTHTVIGMFDTADQAKSAAQQLASAGFSLDHVDVASRSNDTTTNATANRGRYRGNNHTDESTSDSISDFFSNLFSDDDDNARRYAHAARESGSLVTVHAHSDENARQAAEILDRCGAVDVDERAEKSGYKGRATNAKANNTNANANAAVADADKKVSANVIEENLQVGKRVEQTSGGVRLRSRIIERPVEASVRLREEHVSVDRKPVNRPASEADFKAFKEGDIEVTESAERAVVGKEARVVEEVTLGKEVSEREETIHDTVRKTEVDVEKLNTNDRTAGNPRR